jgi:hypothetical protein
MPQICPCSSNVHKRGINCAATRSRVAISLHFKLRDRKLREEDTDKTGRDKPVGKCRANAIQFIL